MPVNKHNKYAMEANFLYKIQSMFIPDPYIMIILWALDNVPSRARPGRKLDADEEIRRFAQRLRVWT